MKQTRNRELSDKQSEFIHGVVHLGLKQTESARRAGYNQPGQSAYNMMNSPGILSRIQQERLKLFQSDLSIVAVQTLKEVMQDKEAPASARDLERARLAKDVTPRATKLPQTIKQAVTT